MPLQPLAGCETFTVCQGSSPWLVETVGGAEGCCPVTFTGFCLEDGTPIGIVIQEDEQIGWFNFSTAVFTPGAPPADFGLCSPAAANAAFGQMDVTNVAVVVPAVNLVGRKVIGIRALAANAQPVYVGLAGVAATTGWELSAGGFRDFDLSDAVQLYVITTSGTQRISYMEMG